MSRGIMLTNLSKRLPLGLMVLLVCAAAGLAAVDWWVGGPAKSVDADHALDLMAVENRAGAPAAEFAVVPPIATAVEPVKAALAPTVNELFASRSAVQESASPAMPAPPVVQTPSVPAPLTANEVDDAEGQVVYFNGRPMRPARTLDMTVTAYSPHAESCGPYADGYTASGYSIWTNGMKLAAADTDLLPFGTVITVPGYNDDKPVPVLDRGGAIKGHRLDMLYPTHSVAMKWGRQKLEVVVWEYADE